MRPDIAAVVLFEGMESGWFTGKTLDQLVDAHVDGDEQADFLHSRAIINGKDRAELIARYAQAFLAALVTAGVTVAKPAPPPPPPAKPAPAPAPAKPASKYRTLLARWMRD